MPKKSKITFAIPNGLKNELHKHVIEEGYGLRGKSIWVSEAIENLLGMNNFQRLISYNDEMNGFDKIETVVVEYALKLKIDGAVVQIRKKYPIIEGVKSRILRTAILQRILRS